MSLRIKSFILFIFICLVFIFFVWIYAVDSQKRDEETNLENQTAESAPDRLVTVEIAPNSTFGILMYQAGVDPNMTAEILAAAQDVYDLATIRVGRTLTLRYNQQSGEFIQLVYPIDTEEELYVTYQKVNELTNEDQGDAASTSAEMTESGWAAERVSIPYELQWKIADGTVATSLYQAALDNSVDVRAIIDLADAYQWTIDFAVDPRTGDTFKFIYEERYRNGSYVMPGRILAAKYNNAGTEYQIYYFEEDEEHRGYYDQNGISVQKELLKAPIQYKYITSGFTIGLRCLESYGLCTGHRAVDYAAPTGTPIRAVGDGTVIYVGWSSVGYGNLTSIRHNGTYTTNYAHQSRIVVKAGQKVKQGETIGYVGSTGLSTGPHLHYEVVKNGTKINPLILNLPPGEPIKEEHKGRFFETIRQFREMLDQV